MTAKSPWATANSQSKNPIEIETFQFLHQQKRTTGADLVNRFLQLGAKLVPRT